MKRLLLGSLLLLALVAAGCGGSSSITPPPPTGPFSNASLSGQYAFSMSGVDTTGAYIARVGSFVADGNGRITSGLEDVVSLGNGTTSLVSFTGGTYEIQSNGRGVVVFQAASGGGLQLNLVMGSTSQGLLVQTDLNATSSGSFNQQTTTQFTAAALKGSYVFDLAGISFSGRNVAPISNAGQLIVDGAGNLTGGLQDINDGNQTAPSGPLAISASTYQLDPANGSTFGRGTLTFGGRSFAFYIVNAQRFKLIEEDNAGASISDAYIQLNQVATSNAGLSGGYVYLVGGSTVTGSSPGPIASLARFSADGNGNIGSISYDENFEGTATHIAQGNNISNAIYAVDTAHPNSGRGTLSFKDSSAGQFSYVFYQISNSQFVIQETSSGVISDGVLRAQSGGPFTNSNVAANYSFNWSGIALASSNSVTFEEDYVGQFALTSSTSKNITGVMDYTQFGLSGKNLFNNIGISGGLTINGDGTAGNNFQVTNGSSPSTTFNFQAYVVSPTQMLLLCTDSTRVNAGVATAQSQ